MTMTVLLWQPRKGQRGCLIGKGFERGWGGGPGWHAKSNSFIDFSWTPHKCTHTR